MRHNEEEIQLGIAIFNKACSDATCSKNDNGQMIWSGTTCEGGGWKLQHKINEDAMTPYHVATHLGLRSILDPVKKALNVAVKEATQKYLSK